MAKANKKKDIVYLIPEGQTRDSHDYHYTVYTSGNMRSAGKKFRVRKYNPVSKKHEWFIEAKKPPHSK